MTIDAPGSGLDRLLSRLEVRSARARRSALPPGGTLALSPDVSTLGYVVSGEVSRTAVSLHACGTGGVARTGAAAPPATSMSLRSGDAFLSSGERASALASASGARLMTAELDIAWPLAAQKLPAFLSVSRFADREPAAAALAAHLGPAVDEPATTRAGDPVICCMMMTTVTLSLIRAWAAAGCAPRRWRVGDADPFLLFSRAFRRQVGVVHSRWAARTEPLTA